MGLHKAQRRPSRQDGSGVTLLEPFLYMSRAITFVTPLVVPATCGQLWSVSSPYHKRSRLRMLQCQLSAYRLELILIQGRDRRD